ncbi:MAG: hypothetical protein H0T54_03040, partial [Geodermatophilaceae bacterium]|nr:hypothetical protein [Geodermatophilaceae bacterium]
MTALDAALALDALKYDGSMTYLTSADMPARTAMVNVDPRTTGQRSSLAITHESPCNVLLSPATPCEAPGMRVELCQDGAADTAVWDIFRGLCTGGKLVICGEVDEDDR